MKTINGTHTYANIMVDDIDEATENQINTICSQEAFKDAKIRIMADTHAGKGVPIGFTAVCNKNRLIPNLVGVDISCTVSAWRLNSIPDFEKLDKFIRQNIPSDDSIRQTVSPYIFDKSIIDDIKQVSKEIGKEERAEYFINSIGTLGGGNHFISVEVDSSNIPWLIVHTGSRNFGYAICEYHQNLAYTKMLEKRQRIREEILMSIEPIKRQAYLESEAKYFSKLDPTYAYLEGEDADSYLKHVLIAQKFALANHTAIATAILRFLNPALNNEYNIEPDAFNIITNHNYVEVLDNENICIRKGAVSAKKDEVLLIPLNMADGTLICSGKGNADWNYSAPHGAGRLMSRKAAEKSLSMDDFENSMKGIWSSCIKQSTIDESPMAYKNADFIINNIGEVVDVIDHLKPVYNFKAS